MTINTFERRNPQKLKNNLLNISIYGEHKSRPDWNDFLDSVEKNGILEPIHILPSDTILSGHGRKTAAVIKGMKEVPVIVHHELSDELDQQEFMIQCNKHRVKTTEQKAREYDKLKEIEEERAKQRMAAGGEGRKIFPTLTKSKKAKEIAASEVGISYPTADKAVEVVEKIDELKKQGETEKAEELTETLNTNVSKAHRQISPAKPTKSKPSKKKPSRFDFKEFNKILGQMVRYTDSCAKHHGQTLHEGRHRVLNEILNDVKDEWKEWSQELK